MKTKLFIIALVCLLSTILSAQIVNIDAFYNSQNQTIDVSISNATDGLVLIRNADELNGSKLYMTCYDATNKVIYDDWWSFRCNKYDEQGSDPVAYEVFHFYL